LGKSIYLINPRESVPGYFSLEVMSLLGRGNFVSIADLSTPTVAAMVPSSWTVLICDDRLTSADPDIDADVIGITGKVTQRERMIELAKHYRRRGKLVMLGGPFVSLSPEEVREHCDILVRGEIEEIAPEIFADIDAGKWKPEYQGGKPDLSRSPLPRWDLYPHGRRAFSGVIQTSRGCPFECEFCDVIQYAGRKQRHKPVAQILAELDLLARLGYRSVFLADDNFTVYRKHAKEILTALRDWNRAHPETLVNFATQVSIDAARDEELLELLAAANVRQVFVGIETPNEASLAETHKRQNLHVDLAGEVEKILNHGVSIISGGIVGFDSDGPDIFDIQQRFIERLPVPIVTIGALVAPPATPLYARMEREGRLLGAKDLGAGDFVHTNIIPKRMSQAELMAGIKRLCREIYSPEAFERRLWNVFRSYRSRASDGRPAPAPFEVGGIQQQLLQHVARNDPELQRLFLRVHHMLKIQPRDVQNMVTWTMVRYAQVLYMQHQAGITRRGPVGPHARAIAAAE
jgi:radical SAM superfamily enzyme YgiQ (UPF0313 family)